MKFIRFIFVALYLVAGIPLFSETPAPEPQKNTEQSNPKYFTDMSADKSVYDENTFWGELVNMFITLGFIILILIALAWVMRRMQSSRIQYVNESSVIKLIDHRTLSAKSVVYLLHVHDRAVIVSESPNGVARVADFPIDENTDAPPSQPQKSRFENYIKS